MRLRTSKELGAVIRGARTRAGLTQADVAGAMRSTQKWVSAVENGKDTAGIGQVLRLLALLRLDVDVLPAGSEGAPAQPYEAALTGRTAPATCPEPAGASRSAPPVPKGAVDAKHAIDLDDMLAALMEDGR